jgi:5-methylcytosine-specific restriction endonuclease McrA
MSRVWWINQSQSYQEELRTGIIYAGHNKDDPARKRVREIRAGDVIVHNSKAHIRALSRVKTNPEPRTPAVKDGSGDVADVAYFELDSPIHFSTFAEAVFDLDIPNGPFQPYNEEVRPRQGYCYAFSHTALSLVREHAETWPSWDALRPEKRHPSSVQTAVDVRSDDSTESDPTKTAASNEPERRAYEVSRVIRDSQLARSVKEKNNYQCQVCGADPIELLDGSWYAEAHHLYPLGEGGPDVSANILCVCPTCHVKLDYGLRKLDDDVIADSSGSTVGKSFVQYHNDHVVSRSHQRTSKDEVG